MSRPIRSRRSIHRLSQALANAAQQIKTRPVWSWRLQASLATSDRPKISAYIQAGAPTQPACHKPFEGPAVHGVEELRPKALPPPSKKFQSGSA
jgi:hypothetical protein